MGQAHLGQSRPPGVSDGPPPTSIAEAFNDLFAKYGKPEIAPQDSGGLAVLGAAGPL